jgi:hypothetical protein
VGTRRRRRRVGKGAAVEEKGDEERVNAPQLANREAHWRLDGARRRRAAGEAVQVRGGR